MGRINIERVDFVSVPTRDVDRAREFYGDVLGGDEAAPLGLDHVNADLGAS